MHGERQKKNRRNPLSVTEMSRGQTFAGCPYSGVDLDWAQHVTESSSPRESVRHLAETHSGIRTAPRVLVTMVSVMFKITQNTLRNFTLAEVLLMAAMNQLEAERKASGNEGSQLDRCPYRAEAA